MNEQMMLSRVVSPMLFVPEYVCKNFSRLEHGGWNKKKAGIVVINIIIIVSKRERQ